MPQYSILITYHNERELLTECLRSLFEGKHLPDEVLVFDDASSSPAVDYIASFPVRVIRSEQNLGPSKGRNRLLKEASGEWIHFHDADDWFFPDWLYEVQKCVKADTQAVFTEVLSQLESGQEVDSNVLGLRALKQDPDLVRFCITHFMLVPSGTYRRDLVQRIGGYREDLWQSEDFDFHVRLASACRHYELIFKPLVGIRLRAASRSRNEKETIGSALQALTCLERELKNTHHKDLGQKAAILGSRAFQIGEKALAREAFIKARSLGCRSLSGKGILYPPIMFFLGQEAAENLSSVYRHVVPQTLRRRLRRT